MPPSPPAHRPITAYSACNALGVRRAEVLDALHAGRSGLGAPPWPLPFETRCGSVLDELAPLPPELSRFDTRVARLLAQLVGQLRVEIDRAVARWGPARVGLLLGTSTAGILTTEAAWRAHLATGAVPATYDFATQHAYDAVVPVVRALTGIRGPAFVVSTACSSSAKVLGSAARLIEAGAIDAALTGGVDSLCETTLHGFHSLGALAPGPCRPFSAERAGISIGEGGALLLVERRGEARARLLGVGESSDAHHISAPHPEGHGARAAMEEALARAALTARDIHHVNAHGTATPLNDRAEGLAIATALGREVPVASTKGYTGHLLGAAGATEVVFAAMALEEGWMPASLGADPPDPEIPVNVVRERTRATLGAVLSNSFAFGGNNVSVILGAP